MSEFALDFISKNEYEFLAVEVSYRGQLLCEINSEHGPDDLEVYFAHNFRVLNENVSLRFPVAQFANAFKDACAALVEVNGMQFKEDLWSRKI
ncbi:hypothetical protein AB8807_13240 [Xanthomonas campestris pv. olitorii]|uniref:hypothetical protein n=1 Tax=Xanthomonas axonopodis TaxID=53413 RepID=UPI001C5A1354|nr:hypothetical protein KWH09_13190 [Xanthomonas campestris pv. olitorii]